MDAESEPPTPLRPEHPEAPTGIGGRGGNREVSPTLMLFPTVTFAIFFLIVLPVSWALMRRQRTWSAFVLVASYVFYGWWNWHYVFLLAGSTVANHMAAVGIHRAAGGR